MPLAVLDEPFDHDGFIFELKYDGFRALAHVDSGRCRLISRNRHECTTFPELCAAIGRALPGQLVLDDEIVYLGKDGCGLRSDSADERPSTSNASICCGRMARICGGCR